MIRPETRELVNRAVRQCLAVRLRLLNRVLSGLYDDALRSLGLRVGQFNLLMGVGAMGPVRPGALAEVLHMDKSTMSRDIDRMCKQGWIASSPAEGARGLALTLTPAGENLLARAMPAWELAQAQAAARLGPDAVVAVHAAAAGCGFPPSR